MNNEQVQTNSANAYEPRLWVTVDEAFVLCQQAGLDRTKKTIRSWCRQEHVESQKQTTPTGERWMVDKASLQVKIRNELEFQIAVAPVYSGSDPSEPVRTQDRPVQTNSNPSDQVQTGTNVDEPRSEVSKEDAEHIGDLEGQVRSLEIDKAVRDRHIEFLSKNSQEAQRQLLSQSRYIGHLETQVLQLGGHADQTFLAPPIAGDSAVMDASRNPNQQDLDVDGQPRNRSSSML